MPGVRSVLGKARCCWRSHSGRGAAVQRLSEGTPVCLEGWGIPERLPEMMLQSQWVSGH